MIEALMPSSMHHYHYLLNLWEPLWSKGCWFRSHRVEADVQGPRDILPSGFIREGGQTCLDARRGAVLVYKASSFVRIGQAGAGKAIMKRIVVLGNNLQFAKAGILQSWVKSDMFVGVYLSCMQSEKNEIWNH